MLLKDLSKISQLDLQEVGAKAANLGELISIGLNVPPGFVVPTFITASFYKKCFSNTDNLSVKDFEFNKVLNQQIPFENSVEEDLLELFSQLNLELVSVRSSATLEDSGDLSFAGIFDTLLNVNKKHLINAIKCCLFSVFSHRAENYLIQNNLTYQNVNMAIIVQEMIEPDISGICFTANPINGNNNEMYIEAAWGLGEIIVSGRVTPDSYIYDINAGSVKEIQVNTQKVKLATVAEQTREIEVDSVMTDKQKLDDDLIAQLVHSCKKIEAHYNYPQDIEFAVKNKNIYFLQARPITTLQ